MSSPESIPEFVCRWYPDKAVYWEEETVEIVRTKREEATGQSLRAFKCNGHYHLTHWKKASA